ncbi:MAG: SMI1/KNR4 family protein [Scytonema sp. PMC 1069.18]|nr:SMI1/KNR4 family protein [Scytonema sp. PMC 1069.18]MEC4881055.1 SMI1/KNR4 family protein [Scytonema sp. PMC 1070.18]
MQAIWTRIETWLKANAPQVLETLNPGASSEQLETVENSLLIRFPDDVKSSYRIHNGQSSYNYGLVNGREFLSLERIQDEWQVWKPISHPSSQIELQTDLCTVRSPEYIPSYAKYSLVNSKALRNKDANVGYYTAYTYNCFGLIRTSSFVSSHLLNFVSVEFP